MKTTIIFLVLLASIPSTASDKKDRRGLLPEIRMETGKENENEQRQLTTEILVTNAETAAIDSLLKLIKKKKNSEGEADLQHRLAELYMRRARTGRFLDLHQNSKNLRLSSFPEAPGRGADWIRKAIAVYDDIEKRFPKYFEMDVILFQNAFAHQQVGRAGGAEQIYRRLLEKFPRSDLIPDAAVALGELAYDQKRFSVALEFFQRAEAFPQSRVYTYALYKGAWADYNLKNTDGAVRRLLAVLKECPADDSGPGPVQRRQNLRRESLRDLGLFTSETHAAADIYKFFKPLTTEDELGQIMADLSRMYLSHSRHKELPPLLGRFLDRHGKNPHTVRARLNLVQSEEALKNRPQVLAHLRQAADDCKPGSTWRKAQSDERAQEACTEGFRQQSREIAARWWETWQKNKNNREFATYTEEALRLVLETESEQTPDGATRMAYGELLFQLERFEEASLNYETAAKDKTLDNEKVHDSLYGALFSAEKVHAANPNAQTAARRKLLASAYVERFPKGEHAGNVMLSLAVIEAESADRTVARKWLKPLLDGLYGETLRMKSEDVTLDLWNQEKNYRSLAADAKAFATRQRVNQERRRQLRDLETQASYAQLRLDGESQKEDVRAQKLAEFAAAHDGETLGHEARLEALALHFRLGHHQKAADVADQILKSQPQEPRLQEILPDLASRLAREGEMVRAAKYLRETARRAPDRAIGALESAADFLLLEGRGGEARGLYRELLLKVAKDDRVRLYEKIQGSLKGAGDSKERRELEELVLQQNLEPFATRLLTERARSLHEAGKATAAFDAARKIMSRSRPATERAGARLVQAKVLEEEFVRQSVKSNHEDRFGMVLAMKTEKLEKAQSAYLSVLKMSEDAKIQAEGLAGVERCLSHYIESLERIHPPASFTPEDVIALRKEIQNLLEPIKSQRDEHRRQGRAMASLVQSGGEGLFWEELNEQDTPVPRTSSDWSYLKPYVPSESVSAGKVPRRLNAAKPRCDEKNGDAATCVLAGKWDLAERKAKLLLESQSRRTEAIHLLALVAEGRGQTDKALWLLRNHAGDDFQGHPALAYEIGRLTAKRDGSGAAALIFDDLLKSSMDSTEIRTLRVARAYAQADYGTVVTLGAAFSTTDLYTLELGLPLSESLAQRGEVDKALRTLAELEKVDRRAEVDIQAARIHEIYQIAPLPAVERYARALGKAKDPAQKEWLKRKIEFMKVNFKVGLHVNSGGL